MKIEEGKIYMTRGGDYVTNLVRNKRRDDQNLRFEGELCQKNGSFSINNWLEDGTFCGFGFEALRDGRIHASDLVNEYLDHK